MNKSSLGAFGIPEYMPPDGGGTFIVNLPAPTSERTTMNESSPGAFGIPESMPPDSGWTAAVKGYSALFSHIQRRSAEFPQEPTGL